MNKTTSYIVSAVCIAILLLLLVISVFNHENANRVTRNFLEYFNLIVTPICLAIGLIIGYPLLKNKLVEKYVLRQFEIMYEANRTLRKECIQIMNQYTNESVSKKLEKQYILNSIPKIENLSLLAFDSNPDAHRYSMILLKSLKEFHRLYPEEPKSSYYEKSLDAYINQHVEEIYNYAKSLGASFDSNVKRKKRLMKKLDKFVDDNEYMDIDILDFSINPYNASQLLVLFFENSFRNIRSNQSLLYLSTYLTAPTPCAIARILYAQELYLPLILQSDAPMLLGWEEKLCLIGLFAKKSSKSNEDYRYYYVCYYANINRNMGFVEGCIRNVDSLSDYRDGYLSGSEFQNNKFSKLELVDGRETLSVEIDKEVLHQAYIKNKKLLIQKFKSEVK